MDDDFKRPAHRQVLAALQQLNSEFLEQCEIFFGGGTRIVLELGEYRESRDLDFLCSSQAGYRLLRESVSEKSLGQVAKQTLALSRDIRADLYGVRTWLALPALKLKLEILREARIPLAGIRVARLPVACLDRPHAFAEKFLANADRGMDASTLSRDAIDLAFMVEGWTIADAEAGFEIARSAYGSDIDRKLANVTAKLRTDRKYRSQCVDGMAITDTRTLSRGLEVLARGLTPK